MDICEFPIHTCAHLHLQALLHIKKELFCSERSGPEQSQDTLLNYTKRTQHFVSVHPQAPFPVTVTFCPSCKTAEAIWDLSCLLPLEFSIKDNFGTALRQTSLNPQRTDCTRAGQNASLCLHRTQPVSTGVQKKLTPSKTSALGPKCVFQILRSDKDPRNWSQGLSHVLWPIWWMSLLLVPILHSAAESGRFCSQNFCSCLHICTLGSLPLFLNSVVFSASNQTKRFLTVLF